jgi:hypothetical protein
MFLAASSYRIIYFIYGDKNEAIEGLKKKKEKDSKKKEKVSSPIDFEKIYFAEYQELIKEKHQIEFGLKADVVRKMFNKNKAKN